MRRKTRKFPDMTGSIRKYKRQLKFAKRFTAWQNMAFSKCQSVFINPNI